MLALLANAVAAPAGAAFDSNGRVAGRHRATELPEGHRFAKVPPGQAAFIDAYGWCRWVDYTAAARRDALFVPFDAFDEWEAFRGALATQSPQGTRHRVCAPPRTVTVCGETLEIDYGFDGDVRSLGAGYNRTETYAVEVTGAGRDAKASWQRTTQSGDCEAPPPVERSVGGGGGGDGPSQEDIDDVDGDGDTTESLDRADTESNSRVICTYFYQRGELSRRDWLLDTRFTLRRLPPVMVKGYHVWSVPVVRIMRRGGRLGRFVEAVMRPIAIERAKQIAYLEGKRPHGSWFGRAVRWTLEPASWAIGHLVTPPDWRELYAEGEGHSPRAARARGLA